MADPKKSAGYKPETKIVKAPAIKPAATEVNAFEPVVIQGKQPDGTIRKRVCNRADLAEFVRRGYKPVELSQSNPPPNPSPEGEE